MVVRVPVIVTPCRAREIPKSITRGPSAAMRMLPGLRSRWTRPRPWIACSASLRPPASRQTAAFWHRPRAVHQFGERRSWHVGRGEPGRAVVRAGVDNGRGVDAADRFRRLHLAPEPPHELGITRQFRVDDLDRDGPAAWRTAQVHPAHPAGAQPCLQVENTHLPRIVRCQRFHRTPRPVAPAVRGPTRAGASLSTAGRRREQDRRPRSPACRRLRWPGIDSDTVLFRIDSAGLLWVVRSTSSP